MGTRKCNCCSEADVSETKFSDEVNKFEASLGTAPVEVTVIRVNGGFLIELWDPYDDEVMERFVRTNIVDTLEVVARIFDD
jgi:hypothetical protein